MWFPYALNFCALISRAATFAYLRIPLRLVSPVPSEKENVNPVVLTLPVPLVLPILHLNTLAEKWPLSLKYPTRIKIADFELMIA